MFGVRRDSGSPLLCSLLEPAVLFSHVPRASGRCRGLRGCVLRRPAPCLLMAHCLAGEVDT